MVRTEVTFEGRDDLEGIEYDFWVTGKVLDLGVERATYMSVFCE